MVVMVAILPEIISGIGQPIMVTPHVFLEKR
jgi:hypothetical protein